MGCLLGGLGGELCGVSQVFRRKVEACFAEITTRPAVCLERQRAATFQPTLTRGNWPACSRTAGRGPRFAAGSAGNAALLKAMLRCSFSVGGQTLTVRQHERHTGLQLTSLLHSAESSNP